MIDNITLEKEFKPPEKFNKANEKPFSWHDVIYSPRYFKGQLQRYEGQLRNLRLLMYPNKIYLSNSLHKFWHGCNYNDFYANELNATFEAIGEMTGINWADARIKKIEYGCNVLTNVGTVINSLKSYKSKDFQPMIKTGVKYGASCGFEAYTVKCYDKEYQVKKLDKICLNKPLLRWEIQVGNAKYFERFKQQLPITAAKLLMPEFLGMLMQDALSIYKNSIKAQNFNLSKLTTHEKRILAEMHNHEIKTDIKFHHKETFKRDRRIYKKIMTDGNICLNDDTVHILEEKFIQLISYKGDILKNHISNL